MAWLRKARKLSFASVSAERYALSAYTSADVLAWFKSPSNFWLSCTLASVTSYFCLNSCHLKTPAGAPPVGFFFAAPMGQAYRRISPTGKPHYPGYLPAVASCEGTVL